MRAEKFGNAARGGAILRGSNPMMDGPIKRTMSQTATNSAGGSRQNVPKSFSRPSQPGQTFCFEILAAVARKGMIKKCAFINQSEHSRRHHKNF
jgi:hypothetical protein